MWISPRSTLPHIIDGLEMGSFFIFLYHSVKFAHILIKKPQGVCRASIGLVACGIVCYAFQAPGENFDIITGGFHCFSF